MVPIQCTVKVTKKLKQPSTRYHFQLRVVQTGRHAAPGRVWTSWEEDACLGFVMVAQLGEVHGVHQKHGVSSPYLHMRLLTYKRSIF